MFTTSKRRLDVSIIYNKSNNSLDSYINVLSKILSVNAIVKTCDPLEVPYSSDINIHLEVPIYVYVPWAPYNVFIKNPESYVKAWDPYLTHFDAIISNESNLLSVLDNLAPKKKITLPPILERKDCPEISVVTLLYNRRRFFELARHNMLLTDYPKDKIQWIIVDDSDKVEEQASDKIIQTIEQFTGMDIHYVPLEKRTPISQKRNIGVSHCSNDIILFMDDDDHYPQTSFRRRVAWLTKHTMKAKAVCCTTIACYDLLKGVSAVNCPPFDIPLGQRISEATLTFYKSWFMEKQFDNDIQVGEGESLVYGRESEVLEIPPQQIIVAFSHNTNTSSRRIPSADNVTPSCFWGFPQEYLTFIHGLAGVKVIS